MGSSSIHDNQQGQEKGAGALKMLATAASFKTTVAFKIPRKKTQEKDAGDAGVAFMNSSHEFKGPGGVGSGEEIKTSPKTAKKS